MKYINPIEFNTIDINIDKYPIWDFSTYYDKDTLVNYNGNLCLASGIANEPEIAEFPKYEMIDIKD